MEWAAAMAWAAAAREMVEMVAAAASTALFPPGPGDTNGSEGAGAFEGVYLI